jgi:amidase
MKEDKSASGAFTRRSLMKAGLAGGALAAAGPLLSPTAPHEAEAVVSSAPFDLEEMTISNMKAGLRSGELTSRSIVESYLGRIEELNTRGPELRAIIEVNPEALEIADRFTASRSSSRTTSPPPTA